MNRHVHEGKKLNNFSIFMEEVEIKVHYGTGNTFFVLVPYSMKLGKLYELFASIVTCDDAKILYIIHNGDVILDFDDTVADLDIQLGKTKMHLVLNYTEEEQQSYDPDRQVVAKYLSWKRTQRAQITPVTQHINVSGVASADILRLFMGTILDLPQIPEQEATAGASVVTGGGGGGGDGGGTEEDASDDESEDEEAGGEQAGGGGEQAGGGEQWERRTWIMEPLQDVVVPLPQSISFASRPPDEGEIGELCTCCQQDVEAGQHIKKLSCGHIYHAECIDEWFKSSVYCPTCRADMRELHS
jgi:Ring finger domain